MGKDGQAKPPGLVRRTVAFALRLRIVRAYLLYSERRGPTLADSITYRALFSVFAGVLLGFSLAALWLGGDPHAMRLLTTALDTVIPGLGEFIDLESIQAPVGFTLVGIVSLLGLVSAAISAISSMRVALRMLADEVYDDGFFLWVLLRNLGVALAFGGLLIVAAALSVVNSAGVNRLVEWLGLSPDSTFAVLFTRVLGVLAVLIIDTIAIALVFWLLSGVKVSAKQLWGGALLGGIGLVVLQELSGLFVRGASSNPLLASFAALIALLLWFNLSAQVILIASSWIITGAAEERDGLRAKYGAATMAQRRRQRAEDMLAAATQELKAAQEAEARELAKRRRTAPQPKE